MTEANALGGDYIQEDEDRDSSEEESKKFMLTIRNAKTDRLS